ncbi:fatty acid desaturase [Pseudanabaena sp. UWO311]|uniref:fatty acid desaturase family protein n=1 Tax=Pseudanabaena sp. UWO311 TaxID=2487337 RepID=UPI001158DE0A|nr:fatty acid desaturase family protein [Pseudanabaena sp. UWO311]TYQ28240.1 fatty acid desaturase [Pseudanabaena sp. UWO311]
MYSSDFDAVDSEATLTSLSTVKDETKVKSAKAIQSSKQILSAQELNILNAKSDLKGTLQLAGHLAVMAGSGYLWATNISSFSDRWYIALPALVLYGFSFAIMFAPLHEASHRTVFTNNRANDVLCWFAGLLSFYNSTFYRLYHKWHHRYTQILDKDPELSDRKPTNLKEYIIEISGITWWIGKFRRHFLTAIGNLENCPFIPESSRAEVIRSNRLQLLVYAVAIAISIYFQQPWFITYWMLPLAVGQPILRFLLLAEHTDRPNTDNMLANTRTTLTLAPLRFLIWNISYHAEHHLYASIPFHQLGAAHAKLSSHFECVENGYFNVHRQIIANFSKTGNSAA